MSETTESRPFVQQIPAEDFGPIIDGHAWWLVDVDGQQGADFLMALMDQPCDTCGGRGDVEGDVKPHRVEGGSLSCHYCRHTFTFNMMRDSGPFVCSCSRSVEARRTPCPADCIDGRRTHTIDVAMRGCTNCGRSWEINGSPETVMIQDGGESFTHGVCDDRWDELPITTHRLSIVPGMILPIESTDDGHDGDHKHICTDGDGVFFLWDDDALDCGVASKIDLPSGARPGRWAVQCKGAS